jgi:hypothetical protein
MGLLGDQRLDIRRTSDPFMRWQRRDLCPQFGQGIVDGIDMVLGCCLGHREDAYS